MSILFDNLNVGDWCAVDDVYAEDVNHGYTGMPIRILSVSYPFILAKSIHGQVQTYDFRYCSFTSISRAHISAWRKHCVNSRGNQAACTRPNCQRCNSPMMKVVDFNNAGAMRWYCQRCNTSGELVNK